MWYWFVKTGWLYCMLIMGIVLVVQLIVNWKNWNILRKLGAFTVIVLVFHVCEEWVIPGGFHYFYNISSEASLRDRYPMNELTDMITNFGGALIWFILVQTDRYERKMSFAVMLFSFAEVIIHILGASYSRMLLLDSGMYSPFYTPGMLTALICWLPLGILYIVYFVRAHIRKWDVIGGVVILIVLSILLITIPEGLLKSEDTPYIYDNAGWYEQYIDDTGAIIEQYQK